MREERRCQCGIQVREILFSQKRDEIYITTQSKKKAHCCCCRGREQTIVRGRETSNTTPPPAPGEHEVSRENHNKTKKDINVLRDSPLIELGFGIKNAV